MFSVCSKAMRPCASAISTLVERFELMRELALILNRKRTKRGSIDFDMPETNIDAGLVGSDDRRHARRTQHRAPHYRRIHAGGQ